jgi:hypothetical protein
MYEDMEHQEDTPIMEIPGEPDVRMEPEEFAPVFEMPTTIRTEAIDQTQISLAQGEIAQMPELRPENWNLLDDAKRVEALQHLEERLAEHVGRDAMRIVPTTLPDRKVGVTTWEQRTLSIDPAIFSDRREALVTLVHEARHGYQMDAIENPWKEDPHRVAVWSECNDHYVNPDIDESIYRQQTLEKDAEQFATTVVDGDEPEDVSSIEPTRDAFQDIERGKGTDQ